MELEIAEAGNRNSPKWKNKKTTWAAFIKRVKKPERTYEKYNEYLLFPKSKQDEIKDVGGFVGGYLTKGRRRKGSIAFRSMLCLDADNAKLGMYESVTLLYNYAVCVYSTHKHSTDTPRYRLVFPLSRHVTTEEYQALGRKIAGSLGIDQFDHTGFQPERLMYYPSVSADGLYECDGRQGPALDVDAVLSLYTDWSDSSEWPMTSREAAIPGQGIKKQGDPLEKPGLIGAFCRTHSITEAIDLYLDEIYEPCGGNERYSYTGGSTAGGLVIYDDKYAFSHHGTDPAATGHVCNAFDLVRIHLFGLQDEDVSGDVAVNKLPSYASMEDLVTKDRAVRKLMGIERLAQAAEDFKGDLGDEPEETEDGYDTGGMQVDEAGDLTDAESGDDLDWLSDLEAARKGRYLSTIDNAVIILRNDKRLKKKLRYNAFDHTELLTKRGPWKRPEGSDKVFTDADEAGLRHYVEKAYKIKGTSIIRDALTITFRENNFHPIKRYLEKTKWDGKKRVSRLLIDYLSAEDNDYNRAVCKKTIVAAVARIYNPGIKFDYILTLIGPEGIGKSTFFKALFGKWFSDSFQGVEGTKAYEQLQGIWCMEVGELAGFKRAEVESVKVWAASQVDRYRVAYGRRVENFPRQCIVVATSNPDEIFQGVDGNRRFWPVVCKADSELTPFDLVNDRETVAQIWAEALHLYQKGEKIFLDGNMEAEARKKQELHRVKDLRATLIHDYLERLLPDGWNDMDEWDRKAFLKGREEGTIERSRVCAAEIWVELFDGSRKDMTTHNTKFIHEALKRKIDWEPYRSMTVIPGYGNQRAYKRVKSVANWS